MVTSAQRGDWQALAEFAWIYPASSACCGQTAESLFALHRFRPKRVINVDRQDIVRTLIAGGVGLGLLHADVVERARSSGEVESLCEAATAVRVFFAYLASRSQDPLLVAASSILAGAD